MRVVIIERENVVCRVELLEGSEVEGGIWFGDWGGDEEWAVLDPIHDQRLVFGRKLLDLRAILEENFVVLSFFTRVIL